MEYKNIAEENQEKKKDNKEYSNNNNNDEDKKVSKKEETKKKSNKINEILSSLNLNQSKTNNADNNIKKNNTLQPHKLK